MKSKESIIHKSKGKHTGLGICSWFAIVFEAQEHVPKSFKKTDDQIIKVVEEEFPERNMGFSGPNRKKTINDYRQKYNNGKFSKNDRFPIGHVYSFRYDEEGDKVDGRTGTIKLSQNEILLEKLEWYKKHGCTLKDLEIIRESSK